MSHPSPRPGHLDRQWLPLALLSVAFFLALLSFSSFNAAAGLIQADWSLSNTEVSLMFSAYLAGFALAALLVVPLTDRLPPRLIMRLGLAILVGSHLLFALAVATPLAGALLRLVMGAGHVAAFVAAIQWVAHQFPEKKRGSAMGLFVGLGYAGTTFSFVLTGWLLGWLGTWRPAYAITAAIGVAGLILVQRVPASGRPADADQKRLGRGRLDLSILHDRALVWIILAYALHTAELYLARLWLPQLIAARLRLDGLGLLEAAADGATLAGWMFMTSIAAVFLGGSWSDRLGRTRTGLIIFTVSGGCSLAAGWLLGLPTPWLLAIGFVFGFSTAADSAIYTTAITELAPPARLGSAQALQSFIGFGIGAVVPIAAGSLLDLFPGAGGWVFAFSFNGLLALAGMVALISLRRLPQASQMAAGGR